MLRGVDGWDGEHFAFGEAEASVKAVPTSVAIDHGADGPTAIIPDAHLLFTAQFSRAGTDLVLHGEDGKAFVVRDYFATDDHARLLSPEGAALSADIVAALVGPQAPGQYAQAGAPPAAAQAVGRVAQADSDATIVRNGVAVAAHAGDAVLKGDVLQTVSGTVGVTFNDGSTLNLTANTRMVVNEFVYDPRGGANSQLLDLVQGSLTFISGEVAHNGNMNIRTPVATMGIRGTVGGVTTATDGTVRFYVSQSATGAVILDSRGTIIANVVQDGPMIIVRPAGPLQVLAEEVQKTPAQMALELAALQQILNIKSIGDQILQQNQTPDPNATPNPQSTDKPLTQFQTYEITLKPGQPDAGNHDQGTQVFASATITNTTPNPDGSTPKPIDVPIPPHVNVAPILDFFRVAVEEGGVKVLSVNDFHVTDPDSVSFSFTVSNVTGGTFQIWQAGSAGPTFGVSSFSITNGHWVDATSFTADDIAAGHVRFVSDEGASAPTFSIVVSDGISAGTAVMITPTLVNGAPVATPVEVNVTEDDSPVTVHGLDGAHDADTGDTLHVDLSTVVLTSSDGQGHALPHTVTYTVNGSDITVDPAQFNYLGAGQQAVLLATYDVVDNHGARVSTSTTITVNGVNDAPVLSSSHTFLSDNFDQEHNGTPLDNYHALQNFTVTGETGLIGSGGNALFDLYPDNGLYLDLRGTGTLPTTVLTSKAVFGPGTYTLTFDLAGTHRNSGGSIVTSNGVSDTTTITFGDFTESFTPGLTETLHIIREVTIGPNSTATLVISDPGAVENRNIGNVLFNVSVESDDAVPTFSYKEGQSPVAPGEGLSLSDADSAVLVSATVAISDHFQSGADVLGFTNQNGISGDYNAQTGVLTLTGEASVADYQTALRSVVYSNTSGHPSTDPRTVTFQVNDGADADYLSNAIATTINVAAVNLTPMLVLSHMETISDQFNSVAYSLSTGSVNWTSNWIETNDNNSDATDNSPAGGDISVTTDPLFSGSSVLKLTDLDSELGDPDAVGRSFNLAGASSATLEFDYRRDIANGDSGDKFFVYVVSNIITTQIGQIGATGNGSFVDSSYAHFSASLFDYISSDVTIRFSVSDDVDDGDVVYVDNIKITTVTPATSYAINYFENGAPLPISATGNILTDSDDTQMQSATILLADHRPGDILSVIGALPSGITASTYNATTGVLTLLGAATLSEYAAALHQVGFSSTSDNPGSADRTINVSIFDGSDNSNTASVTVHVTPVNDAPTGSDAQLTGFVENRDVVFQKSALLASISDPDGDALSVVSVSSTSAHSGTLTVNGDQITYHPNPGYTGFDYFIYTVSDGHTTIDRAATFTVNVNQPPDAQDDHLIFAASNVIDGDGGSYLSFPMSFLAINDDPDGGDLFVATVSSSSSAGQGVNAGLSGVSYNLNSSQRASLSQVDGVVSDSFEYQITDIATQHVTGATASLSIVNSTTLSGGTTNDILVGSGQNETLTGGAGVDGFVFMPGLGQDIVTDFTPGVDKIVLAYFNNVGQNQLSSQEAEFLLHPTEVNLTAWKALWTQGDDTVSFVLTRDSQGHAVDTVTVATTTPLGQQTLQDSLHVNDFIVYMYQTT